MAAEYVRRGHRVMAMKHASHPVSVDTPGTDTYKYFHEGKADRVLIASPDVRGLFERVADDTDPIAARNMQVEILQQSAAIITLGQSVGLEDRAAAGAGRP